MLRHKTQLGGRANISTFRNTLELPTQLQKELGLAPTDGRSERFTNRQRENGRYNKPVAGTRGRKEKRKAERDDKKLARGQRSRKVIQETNAFKNGKTAHSQLIDEGNARFTKPLKSILKKPATKGSKQPRQDQQPVEGYTRSASNSPAPSEESSNASRSSSPGLRLDATSRTYKDHSMQEDADIAALEKKLGSKRKTSRKGEEDDFGDLLGGLDDDSSSESESKKRKWEESEWLRGKRRKLERAKREKEIEVESVSSSAEEFDGLDGSLSDDSADGADFDNVSDDEGASAPRVRENPYVPPVPVPASSQRYIPPSLRKTSDADSESLVRLRRQIQGLLNKLSEPNMTSILQELERLYSNNPRQSVTVTFVNLLLDLIFDCSPLQSTFIILHAGFAAGVYKTIGTDFGAELIANLVNRFDDIYQRASKKPATSKETTNAISFLSHLYTFHVTSSVLIFDYIRLFLTSISELNTELLLKTVRDSGPQLRQDDPSSLKDIVLMLQKLAAGQAASAGREMSVRTKFMIETITDLKNNKLKAGAFASSLASEHITRMRKTLSSLGARRSLRATEPLRISFVDIHNRDRRGKWWLIGASWKDGSSSSTTVNLSETLIPDASTNDPISLSSTRESHPTSFSTPMSTISPDSDSDSLLALARYHRLSTTPLRLAIFLAIMSASDYMDASARLRRLPNSLTSRNSKHTLEMEIPRVLLQCAALVEREYNPYYTLIAREMCRLGQGQGQQEGERKGGGRGRGKVGLQFALWGWFRRWGEGEGAEGANDDEDLGGGEEDAENALSQTVNLAKMFGHLIAERALPLTILKTLDILAMGRRVSVFCEVLLITVFQRTAVRSSKEKEGKKGQGERDEEVFEAVREAPQMVAGLRWFLKTVVRGSDLVVDGRERKRVKRGCERAFGVLEVRGGSNKEEGGGGEDEGQEGFIGLDDDDDYDVMDAL